MVHSLDPKFIIHFPANDCCRTFTNFRTYQNHCLTHHNSVSIINEEVNVEGNSHNLEIGMWKGHIFPFVMGQLIPEGNEYWKKFPLFTRHYEYGIY